MSGPQAFRRVLRRLAVLARGFKCVPVCAIDTRTAKRLDRDHHRRHCAGAESPRPSRANLGTGRGHVGGGCRRTTRPPPAQFATGSCNWRRAAGRGHRRQRHRPARGGGEGGGTDPAARPAGPRGSWRGGLRPARPRGHGGRVPGGCVAGVRPGHCPGGLRRPSRRHCLGHETPAA